MFVGLTMSATKYVGNLKVTINSEEVNQEAAVSVVEEGGTYTLSIKNFMLGEDTPVGNIILPGLSATDTQDGKKQVSFSGTILIDAGDDPRFTEDDWLGPAMLNPMGGVPVIMTATFNEIEMACHIDIDMTNSPLQQLILVDFNSYDSFNKYQGILTVTINEEVVTQEASIKIFEYNGEYTLAIFNFMLGDDIPVGDIILSRLTPTINNNKKEISYTGVIMISAGDDPQFTEDDWLGPAMLNPMGGVPVVMTATFTDTEIKCHIDIDMRNSPLQQLIEVDFESEQDQPMVGDLDGNGLLEVNDVVILAELAMSGGATAEQLAIGDLDGSGTIDVNDVVLLAGRVMGS